MKAFVVTWTMIGLLGAVVAVGVVKRYLFKQVSPQEFWLTVKRGEQ